MKIKEFFKKRKKLVIISGIVLILLIVIISRGIASRNAASTLEYVTVEKGTVNQEVSVTGKVFPAEAIDFAFETSGKVAKVNVKVGDKINEGATLASLKNNDVGAQVSQAAAGVESAASAINQYQAMVDAQKIKLQELRNGSRTEDVALSQAKVDGAKKTVSDNESNLANVQAKAVNDLNAVLNDCANSAASAINVGLNALSVLSDVQYAHFMGMDQDGNAIADAKERAANSLVGAVGAGRWMFQFISSANGGAKASVALAQSSPTEANVVKALNDTSTALSQVSVALNAVPINNALLTTTERSSIAAEKTSVVGQTTLISGKSSSISTQKSVNQSLILSAQNQLSQARTNLTMAEQELNLKKAGATAEQIATQESAIRQAEANMASAQAQLRSAQASLASISAQYSKSVLTSTISGTVTKVNVKAGEMAPLSTSVISVMTDAKFKVEANVPEADIAKIKVDNSSKITLDAYGSDVSFDAKVVKIDPAETVIEGVSTYKVTFEFINEDARIKSGMTANTTISTDKREKVLLVPQRSLVKKDGVNYVLVSDDGKTTHEAKVEIGLVGSDGNAEILSGLSEGQKIVNPSSIKK